MNFIVNLDVPELQRAIAFYGEAFGLQVGRRFGASGVEMLGGPTPLYLLVKQPKTAAAQTTAQRREYGRHWTPLHLDFVVADIESAVRKALDAGASLEKPVIVANWGKLALMADPFGHGFCFVQFVGRGYDEIAEP